MYMFLLNILFISHLLLFIHLFFIHLHSPFLLLIIYIFLFILLFISHRHSLFIPLFIGHYLRVPF